MVYLLALPIAPSSPPANLIVPLPALGGLSMYANISYWILAGGNHAVMTCVHTDIVSAHPWPVTAVAHALVQACTNQACLLLHSSCRCMLAHDLPNMATTSGRGCHAVAPNHSPLAAALACLLGAQAARCHRRCFHGDRAAVARPCSV
eukprot:scpid30316/ scgid14342/ 